MEEAVLHNVGQDAVPVLKVPARTQTLLRFWVLSSCLSGLIRGFGKIRKHDTNRSKTQ